MPEEFKPGCQRPSIKKPASEATGISQINVKEAIRPVVKVGKPAPEFTASAFCNGKFMNISLSEYKGKLVLLYFQKGEQAR